MVCIKLGISLIFCRKSSQSDLGTTGNTTYQSVLLIEIQCRSFDYVWIQVVFCGDFSRLLFALQYLQHDICFILRYILCTCHVSRPFFLVLFRLYYVHALFQVAGLFSDTIIWAGWCPRNDQSSKKVKSTNISRVSAYLKPLLVQIANGVVKSDKHPECKERYRRIKARRWHKKATIAVCRMLLTAI